MSLRKKLLLGLVSLVGTSALAEGQSEFFYQTAAGKSALSLNAGYYDQTAQLRDASGADFGKKVETSGLYKSGVAYEMGLTDMASFEAVLNVSAMDVKGPSDGEPKGQIAGLHDLQLNYKGTIAMGFGRIRYGLLNQVGLLHGNYGTSSNGQGMATKQTASDGGYTFTPYIGADMDLGSGNIGAKFSYELIKTDRFMHNVGNGGYIMTGGQAATVSLFYEQFMGSTGQSLIGLALDLQNVSSSRNTSNAAVGLGTHQSGYATYGAELYGRWAMTDTWSLIPSVRIDKNATNYYVDMQNSGSYIKNSQDLAANVAVRYAF